jgi:hypothetical protein
MGPRPAAVEDGGGPSIRATGGHSRSSEAATRGRMSPKLASELVCNIKEFREKCSKTASIGQ